RDSLQRRKLAGYPRANWHAPPYLLWSGRRRRYAPNSATERSSTTRGSTCTSSFGLSRQNTQTPQTFSPTIRLGHICKCKSLMNSSARLARLPMAYSVLPSITVNDQHSLVFFRRSFVI